MKSFFILSCNRREAVESDEKRKKSEKRTEMKMRENISFPFPALIENSTFCACSCFCVYLLCAFFNQTIIIKYWCLFVNNLWTAREKARKAKKQKSFAYLAPEIISFSFHVKIFSSFHLEELQTFSLLQKKKRKQIFPDIVDFKSHKFGKARFIAIKILNAFHHPLTYLWEFTFSE